MAGDDSLVPNRADCGVGAVFNRCNIVATDDRPKLSPFAFFQGLGSGMPALRQTLPLHFGQKLAVPCIHLLLARLTMPPAFGIENNYS